MKLTIITINRNDVYGLEKTIHSVLIQTWKSFEYIIVDGASTDNSVEVIKRYEKGLSFPYYWLSEPDTGVYQAMNKGIVMAKGEYVLFLNSGDFLVDKNALKNIFETNRKADILCAKCNVLKNNVILWTSNPPDEITFGFLYFQGLNHQSTFIKRSLFETIGYYDETYKYNADIEFWYRAIILNNATTEKLDIILTNYNLEGISEKDKYSTMFLMEHQRIKELPVLCKIFPDYDVWKTEREYKYLWDWTESRRIIFKVLRLLYKIDRRIRRK